MREIKFRGFSETLNKWVIGVPYFSEGNWWILVDENTKSDDIGTGSYFIDKNSIGQHTGLFDKQGVEIYEGDLLQSFYDDGEIHEVIWHEESASFRVATYMDNLWGGSFAELFFMDDIHENCNKIIGNIYENSNLLDNSTKILNY